MEGTVVEIVGEEMKEEGAELDIKNPQEVEVYMDFSSTEGTVGQNTKEEGAEVDMYFSSAKGTVQRR
ncbi:hypothetical protein H5410_050435 [Solanum commersonii]|uniref:Uncharacterized protein n=1 Tax=Solanum commersonii TaxID=4109 RepID=A0A9J5WXV3_SOLCO|nr:hypothetical protein H5410_050435 [Solanum commersonii]